MSTDRLGKALAVCAVLLAMLWTVPAWAESRVRIVRLSEVQGSVQIDRAASQGFEKAFLNLPVIEGARLRTGNDGRAEVEFEDGSALRIVPNSEVEFTRLALGDDGAKLNAVQLKSGVAYLNVRAKKGDQFTLHFAQESVTVPEFAHFRVDLKAAQPTLSVFKGEINGTGPAGEFEVAEKHSATFDPANNDTFTLAKSYDQDPNDAWDRQQTQYHNRYANGTHDISSPYGYGISDLNYYGSYFNCPGYGFGWQPYLAGAGWSPFQDGAWAWYPGFGYTWVSGYPWGWMPYRYGSWGFASGCGWMWQPGLWNTFYVIPRVVNPPVRTRIPTPPIRGRQIVAVGRGLAANPATPPVRMAVNPGSAGFGVPRGSVRHLDRVAREADKGARPVMVTIDSRAPVSTATTTVGSGGSSSSASRSASSMTGSRGAAPSRTSSSPHSSSSSSHSSSPHR
jgi:uncharacterized protein DUF6600/FecR-like protein